MFGLFNNYGKCNNNNEYGWIWIVIIFLMFTECNENECCEHDPCDPCKKDEGMGQWWIILILLFIAFSSNNNSPFGL